MSEPPKSGWAADLPRRALVGIILVAVAVFALVQGGIALWVLTSVMALLMMMEWAELAKVDPKLKQLSMFALSVPLAILSPLAAGPDFFALGLIAGAAFFVTMAARSQQLGIGVVYAGIPAASLLFLRDQDNGLVLAFWTLAIVWATDIGAYFAGRLIGGPKLWPAVSPSKTWAGLGGGMAAALLTGLAFHHWGALPLGLALSSAVLAVVAQGGDLYESALKRKAGVKDSGTILPGHGGVLDRLDGVVPVAPMVAVLVLTETLL
ncbi:phosphatidate cytidylyltransferase [Sphingomonas cavernae]|uniref:Phosphatidate cytidylyltransferase n=1 Tax=Sphingomonas cavernae TaxID=2320861 RepID=A0A418WM76_9SPHN|nr:phosphatidate cytidylyltransferase [Sphingomonas cavernae]RJF91101.1 phosphatidate cytidylyltransferase [Sphingomonas cavernae]